MCQMKSKKQRSNELKLKRLIKGQWINKLAETVFAENNELKDSVNKIGDRDRAVSNTLKCEEEKFKGDNCKNAAVNLTTETNRILTDQKACLDKNSNLRDLLNFPMVTYAAISKQAISTVKHTSAPVSIPS